MSGISGIGGSSSVYSQLASGTRVQRAADDAAGLAISEKLQSQSNGYDVGTRNAQDAVSALNISDAALSGVTDYLQRIRELAVGASNGILSSSDKQAYQDEINQLKEGISNIASQTNFNGINLLDGSNPTLNIATNGNGDSMSMSGADATLQALGIANFDVTGNFNIDDIDNAISMVSSARSSAGAQTNALEHIQNYNTLASLNLTSANSNIKDLDMAQGVSELKKQQLLEDVQFIMQKKKQDDENGRVTKLFRQGN